MPTITIKIKTQQYYFKSLSIKRLTNPINFTLVNKIQKPDKRLETHNLRKIVVLIYNNFHYQGKISESLANTHTSKRK